MKRIVLTGGPGAGKTRICEALAAADPARLIHVPEAATQVYSALGSRWDRMNTDGRRYAQRRIYAVQTEQEARYAADYPNKIHLLDRGTIDGAAYWPDGPDAYWRDVKTTLAAELSRYDTVIWLETAAALGIYDGEQSNPVRFEPPEAAIESGRQLKRLWGDHPKLLTVGAFATIEEKIAAVAELLNSRMQSP
jgi:predicted ATPase